MKQNNLGIYTTQRLVLQSMIETYLEMNDIVNLNKVIDDAIEHVAYMKTPEYAKEFKDHYDKLANSIPTSNNFKIIEANNQEIKKLEDNCLMLQSLSKRIDLAHLERTGLLFIYMQLGTNGEERLRQIMQQQKNYSENMTNSQINQVKNKKTIGISCEKLVEWCVCNEKKCKLFKQAEYNNAKAN